MRGPLPQRLKRSVLWTQTLLSLRALGPGREKPGRCHGAGFEIEGYSLSGLSFLFSEVFVGLDYYFESPVEEPYILDCGSNIGMAVLFFKALYPRARIVAFEPGPDSFAMLQRNVRQNQLTGIELRESAVGDRDGTVDFFLARSPGSVTSSTRAERTGQVRTTVVQERLSTYLDRDVDFLKLDIEGGEWAVMHDLVTTGTLRRISKMAIEYHHHMAPSEDRFGEFLQQLEAHGFGYQLSALAGRDRQRGQFQDALIYAYRKD